MKDSRPSEHLCGYCGGFENGPHFVPCPNDGQALALAQFCLTWGFRPNLSDERDIAWLKGREHKIALDRDRSREYSSDMAKTDAERKAAERARRTESGLQRYELWLHPRDWTIVRRFVERLKKRSAK